jgi:hypothetical protein
VLPPNPEVYLFTPRTHGEAIELAEPDTVEITSNGAPVPFFRLLRRICGRVKAAQRVRSLAG